MENKRRARNLCCTLLACARVCMGCENSPPAPSTAQISILSDKGASSSKDGCAHLVESIAGADLRTFNKVTLSLLETGGRKSGYAPTFIHAGAVPAATSLLEDADAHQQQVGEFFGNFKGMCSPPKLRSSAIWEGISGAIDAFQGCDDPDIACVLFIASDLQENHNREIKKALRGASPKKLPVLTATHVRVIACGISSRRGSKNSPPIARVRAVWRKIVPNIVFTPSCASIPTDWAE